MAMEFIRKKTSSFLTVLLFGVIISTFVFFGTGETGPGSSSVLTTVNGESIAYREFQRTVNQRMQSYGQLFGGEQNINRNLMKLIEQQVVNSMVSRKVLAQQARELGIYISDQDLLERLQEIEAFQDPEKQKFSPRIYQLVLEANDLKPADFEDSLREEMQAQRLNQIIETSLFHSRAEIADRQKIENYSFRLESAEFDQERLEKSAALSVSEEEIQQHYANFQAEFLTSEQRKLEVARLDLIARQRTIQIPEEEIQAFYRANVEQMAEAPWNEERARALHILVSDKNQEGRAKLRTLQDQLNKQRANAPATEFEAFFRNLAREESDDLGSAYRDGDLGYFNRTRMVKAFSDAVFNENRKDTFVGPVESDFGFHFILVLDRTTAENSLENRRKEIAYNLAKEKIIKEKAKITQQASNQLNSPSKRQAFFEQYGFSTFTTEFLMPSDRDDVLPASLLRAAFQTETNQWSGPEEFEDNVYFFQVVDIQEPQTQPLEQARETVIAQVKKQKLRELANQVQQDLQAGDLKWSDLKSKGARLRAQNDFKAFQATEVPNFGASEVLLRAVQNLHEAQPLSEAIFNDGKYVIFRASDFSDTVLNAENLKQQKENLSTAKQASVLDRYIQTLIEKARIPSAFREEYGLGVN